MPRAGAGEPRGELDKRDLRLEPVVVGPQIRRYGDRIVYVDPHDSHRWKRADVLGESTKI